MITLIAITAIATAPTCCAAHPGSGNTDIKIAVNELTPQPVEPGRDLVLSVTLGNYGRGAAEHVVLTIMPDSPIILKNENDRIMRFEKIIGYTVPASRRTCSTSILLRFQATTRSNSAQHGLMTERTASRT